MFLRNFDDHTFSEPNPVYLTLNIIFVPQPIYETFKSTLNDDKLRKKILNW